jgi:predicted DNA-binding transcriptional regulator YafY
MRADRLLSILMLLQTKGRMTAHDLAEQLEVSERTIYRDVEALGMAGIPVYTERGPGGGCSLVDGYQTRLTGLTESEVQSLFLLATLAPRADFGLDETLDEALLKLMVALPASSRDRAEAVQQRFLVDTSRDQQENTVVNLRVIQRAICQDQPLHLIYNENGHICDELLVEPYGLVSSTNCWYLIARYNGAYQVYNVAYIRTVLATSERFERARDFNLAQYWHEYCVQVEASYVPTMEQSQAVGQSMHVGYAQQQQPWKTMPAASTLSSRRLMVLDASGSWRSVHHSSREKKRFLKNKNEKKRNDFNNAGLTTGRQHLKKNGFNLQVPTTSAAKKKNEFRALSPVLIKKTKFPPDSHLHRTCNCAAS